jgi:hypothetical protein
VFFARPHDPTSRLQTFGTLIRRRFREAGLITETRPLVLHATVANMTYVRGKGRCGGRGKGRRSGKGIDTTVNGREILRFFNGEGDVDEMMRALKSSSTNGGKLESSTQTASHPSPGPNPSRPHSLPFIWANDIPITSIRICKMGAQPCATPSWGLEYRAVAERAFSPLSTVAREREGS